MRIVFMGTPDFAVPTLSELVGHGHEIVAVYSRPPARSGRGMDLKPSPVHKAAERFGIPVVTPTTLRTDEAAAAFRQHDAELAIVVAYGMILPQAILDAPTLGCLNLHASLLPRWRGAAPIQRAVMAGDRETGVAVMKMEKGLDTGPVAMVERVAIGPGMTAGDLHDQLSILGADLMVRAVAALSRGGLSFTPQPTDGVTYAAKITNDECRIDWARSAQEVHDFVRGLSPFPGAFASIDFGKGPERLKILRAAPLEAEGHAEPGTVRDDFVVACGTGSLRILQIQRTGGRAMAADEFLRGVPLPAGTRLG